MKEPLRSLVFFGGLGLATLAVYLVLFDRVFMPYAVAVDKVNVPKLTGLTLEQARRQLQQRGLRLAIRDSVYHENLPAGLIAEQVPAERQQVKKGRRVSVDLSKGQRLYCAAGAQWDRVVLQLFDASVIAAAEIVRVPLECEDIRGQGQRLPMSERIARLTASIKRVQVSMKIDYRDTLANIFFDGLSASESFFMEALYESGRFPCLFVGGSAGGKLDFQRTQLHDGQRSYQNHALIVFLKCARNVRFGVFKSQNFEPTPLSLSVLSASLEDRYISQVVDARGNIRSMVQALCEAHRGTLAEAFVVSGVAVERDGTTPTSVAAPVPGLVGVRVERAAGKKCARCWKHLTTVGAEPAHPQLCDRCVRVLAAISLRDISQ